MSIDPRIMARLSENGITVDGQPEMKPCWQCRDEARYHRALVALATGDDPGGWNSKARWHPWHDDVTMMPEWTWLQRLAFRLGWWKPACDCRACNGYGQVLSIRMRMPETK